MSVLHIALLQGCDELDIAFLPGCNVAQQDNGRLGVAPLQGDVGLDGVLQGGDVLNVALLQGGGGLEQRLVVVVDHVRVWLRRDPLRDLTKQLKKKVLDKCKMYGGFKPDP